MVGTLITRTLLAAPLALLFFVSPGALPVAWIAGLAICLVALQHLVVELRRGRRAPVIAVAVVSAALFVSAFINSGHAWSQTGTQARAFAEEMQAQCVRDGTCPPVSSVCASPSSGGDACKSAGSFGVQYPIRYRVTDDGRSFAVSWSMGSDDATVLEGGVGRTLERRRMMDGVDVDADAGAP